MNRRRFIDEPMSRLALWSYRLALFSLAATLLSIIIVRLGLLELRPALATVGAALACAAAAVVLALGGLVIIWMEGVDGLGKALWAIAIGIALLAYPGYLATKLYRLPAVYDITTSLDDPPRYEAIARLRPRDANSATYAGAAAAQQQRQAYPDIEPVTSALDADVTYDTALAVITKRKWRIVDARPPQTGRREGHIEAIARSAIMGFRDDVALRVRSTSDGAVVDIRSSSRYGSHDLGANAARVRALAEDIDDAIGVVAERQPPAERPIPAPAPAPQRRAQPKR